MDLFPVDTNIAACSHPFVEHELVVAGRVFEGPFEVACDQAESLVPDPFHCSAHSNAMAVVFVPMVRLFVLMEDLNL